jgi:hypothetical protein
MTSPLLSASLPSRFQKDAIPYSAEAMTSLAFVPPGRNAGGRYAQVSGHPDRPKFKESNNVRLETPAAQYGEAARAFAGNFGTWSVNEADKILTRRYEAALVPNVEATDRKESVSLTGDEVKLISTSAAGLKTEAVYRRAK